ncbi:MAG: FAD-binding oxidoreductase [Gammaproteobacteria bacterium]|nr:FAD-binding oxidoreductase [Gammaproteobacteria bacterium]
MLPSILPEFTIDPLYESYLKKLKKTVFSGEICMDYASRLAISTDNSIYQVIPQAVILPKSTEDIAIALTLGAKKEFQKIKFTPRGGGTSPNGQSLSPSIMIDCSKHMRNILEINTEEGWVRVQPGVVQDQLNQYLLSYDAHFAPEISPSNRATIGGMINTDACGNGQKIIGRTSDHIVELIGILADGTVFSSLDLTLPIFSHVSDILIHSQELIKSRFPKTPRTFSGYNILKAYNNGLNLNYLLSGSEGTLTIISECKLKLTPLPAFKKLIVVQYRNFNDALCALDLANVKPLVIECIDEKLLELARQDPIYFYIKDFIECKYEYTAAVNLVEFISNSEEDINAQIKDLLYAINSNKGKIQHAIGYYVAESPAEIKKIWELRKKSVGLISKNKVGTRRPIPFIEDTAVAPEHLVNYIAEFKALLDQYKLSYGMYGHVDAGCVHVRPALDLQLHEDRDLHKTLSDKIVILLQKYNGVMWGEHGLGFRSVYNPVFLGEELYAVIRKIKTLFDPHNKLNPGKIAVPFNCTEEIVGLSDSLRGHFDQQIPEAWQAKYSSALVCNGNGACFNYATQETMCPSFKVMKERIHSPKGRATVMREWLRQLSRLSFRIPSNVMDLSIIKKDNFLNKCRNKINKLKFFLKKCVSRQNKYDFSHEVFAAFAGCLGCKACTNQCPLNVDIPDLKASFLALYYQRYFRPLRDYFIGAIETLARLQGFFPQLTNALLRWKLIALFFKKIVCIVDVPLVSPIALDEELRKRDAPAFSLNKLHTLTLQEKENSVIIIQDAFTRFYHPEVLLAAYDLFTKLGIIVYIAPFFINGKPYHVKGFLYKFKRLVKHNILFLNKLAQTQISLVGIDPSMTLTYRDEYQKALPHELLYFNVLLPQEWLQKHLSKAIKLCSNKNYVLLTHCTEKTMCVAAEKQWVSLFAAFGLSLEVLPAGCCGMSGAYGHEAEHRVLSKELFHMDWAFYLKKNVIVLATGYSCRSQALRFSGKKLQHPLEVLIGIYQSEKD